MALKTITISMLNERWNSANGFDLSEIIKLSNENLNFFLEHASHADRCYLVNKLKKYNNLYEKLKPLIIFA